MGQHELNPEVFLIPDPYSLLHHFQPAPQSFTLNCSRKHDDRRRPSSLPAHPGRKPVARRLRHAAYLYGGASHRHFDDLTPAGRAPNNGMREWASIER